MSDGTRSRDNSVPGAAAGGAADIATRLRRARGNYNAGVYLGYDRLLFRLNRNGELERLLEAVEIDIELDRAGGHLRNAYERLLENVSDE